VDGVQIKLADDAGSVLFLPKLNMPRPGMRTTVGWSRGGRRIGRGEGVIVVAVLLAVFVEGEVNLQLESGEVGAPARGQRAADLGADEVIGATGAEEG